MEKQKTKIQKTKAMKKILLFATTLLIGLTTAAQYANPKENAPCKNDQRNTLFPSSQVNADNPVIYKHNQVVLKSAKNIQVSGASRNSYVSTHLTLPGPNVFKLFWTVRRRHLA